MFFKKGEETKKLSDKRLFDFANYMIKKKFQIPKTTILNEEEVALSFDLSQITTAIFPLMIKQEIGRDVTLEELTSMNKDVNAIINEERVFRFKDIETLLRNDKEFSWENVIKTKQLTYKEYNGIVEKIKPLNFDRSTKQGRDFEKQVKHTEKSEQLYRNNIDTVTNAPKGSKFIIVNDEHTDKDECDNYIGNVYEEWEIEHPPYHYNCMCRVEITDTSD